MRQVLYTLVLIAYVGFNARKIDAKNTMQYNHIVFVTGFDAG